MPIHGFTKEVSFCNLSTFTALLIYFVSLLSGKSAI